MTEIVFDDDEILTNVTAGAGSVIDNLQFATNVRSFPVIGNTGLSPNSFISSSELLYFTGSEIDWSGLRVSGVAAMATTCSTD